MHNNRKQKSPTQSDDNLLYHQVISSFSSYESHALRSLSQKRTHYKSLLPPSPLLTTKLSQLSTIASHIKSNQSFLSLLIPQSSIFTNTCTLSSRNAQKPQNPQNPNNPTDKVISTLKQCVRDWSPQGLHERFSTYSPILTTLCNLFPNQSTRPSINILVPGAGLARLPYEITLLHFSCQGNEFSYHMLLASHFILNSNCQSNQYTLYPWIHTLSNWKCMNDALSSVTIPDIPIKVPNVTGIDFSMVGGDFCSVYACLENYNKWDAVVTCFFIDTGRNSVEYIKVIKGCLKEGGVWVNMGPLLYHFEGGGDESLELSEEEVVEVAEGMGFVFEERRRVETSYVGNERNMLKYVYDCGFWVARKGKH